MHIEEGILCAVLPVTITGKREETVRVIFEPTGRKKNPRTQNSIGPPVIYGLHDAGNVDLVVALSPPASQKTDERIKVICDAAVQKSPDIYVNAQALYYTSLNKQVIDDGLLCGGDLGEGSSITKGDRIERCLEILYFSMEDYCGYDLHFAAKDFMKGIINEPEKRLLIRDDTKERIAHRMVTIAAENIKKRLDNPHPGLAWRRRILDIIRVQDDSIGMRPHLVRALKEMEDGAIVIETLRLDKHMSMVDKLPNR